MIGQVRGYEQMKDDVRKQLLLYEEKNARIFQVMGSLKLLNNKAKDFVKKLELVSIDDVKKQKELNRSFRELRHEVQCFEEEHKHFVAIALHIPTVDVFATNAKHLFSKDLLHEYSIIEMRKISVYIYRMADQMLKELKLTKVENESTIHDFHAENGKYYMNRK